ncbi:MAG: cyclic nucleotide-binding domain-containing protein [Kofleriaceae bacterium]
MIDLEAPSDFVERELDLRAEMPFVQSDAQLQQLLAIARHVDFRDGDHMYEQGSAIASLYLILSGDVDLVSEQAPTWRFTNTGAIGFLDFMMGRANTRTAIARGDVRALEIDQADYAEFMQDHSEIGHQMLSQLSANLIETIAVSDVAPAVLNREEEGPIPDTSDLALVDRLMLLSRVPAFSRATVQSLANLAQNTEVVVFAAGDLIEQAGAHSDRLSILIRGTIELSHPDRKITVLRRPVDLVCHAAELTTNPRPFTARAVNEAVVFQIDREELLDRLDEHFELTQSLFAYIAGQRERFNNLASIAGVGL